MKGSIHARWLLTHGEMSSENLACGRKRSTSLVSFLKRATCNVKVQRDGQGDSFRSGCASGTHSAHAARR
eukprot:4970999-Prymnesium_polylepis.1